MFTIALPSKGRVYAEARELFADAGLPVRSASDRSLSVPLGNGLQAIFMRPADIPHLIAQGVIHAGVTGQDMIAESGHDIEARVDLEIGQCRLALAVREDDPATTFEGLVAGAAGPADGAGAADGKPPRVATSFPRLTRSFFEERNAGVTLVSVSGSAEIAPRLGIADAVSDLVQTGSTLRSNGLRELCTLFTSSTVLATRSDTDSAVLDDVTLALDSVVRARRQRYLMANVPQAALDEVKELLPGLNGPTVGHVLNGGRFVAVQAVVAEEEVYSVVAKLKALACEGILVTRVERLVP